MRTHIRILLCGLAALPGILGRTAAGQERNMARLTLSDTTFTVVTLGLHGENGDFQEKDIFMPEAMLRGTLDAFSRRNLDRVYLYGHFGYNYELGRRSTWRGWIDPYETPFMLADSIPGDISLERYAMQAGIALPMKGGWSAGIDLAYDVALMAKHKDLRNKNTGMTFRVAPGLQWQGRRAGVGLDLGYERGTEKVEYSQESSSVEHVLFSIYGLWVGQGYGFASAETKRLKENDRFFGDLQLDFLFGNIRLHNNFHLDWRLGVQSETGYNNLRHGDVRAWTWRDDLLLQIGAAHRVEAGVSWSTMQGLRPLQRQELDPDSRIRIWVDVGDPVFCYFRRYDREYLRYTYGTSWKLRFELENLRISHAYTEYPHRFSQRVSTLVPRAGAELPLGKNWELSLRGGYIWCYEADYEISRWQLAAPLEQQCRFWTGNSVMGGVSAAWTRGRMTLGLDYGFEAATAFDGARHTASLTLGFVF